MKQALQINIPTPCTEDWDKMPQTAPNERHCAVCVRNLTDFSTFTDREIHAHLSATNGRLCGRFRPDQLGRPIIAEHARASKWRTWLTAAGILLSGSIAAQLEAEPKAKSAIHQPVQQPGRDFNLNGIVSDADGQPLPYATVAIYSGKYLTHGTVTDIDGHFTLRATTGDTVRISFMGFKTEVYSLDAAVFLHDPFLDVILEESSTTLDEVTVTAYRAVGKYTTLAGGIHSTSRTTTHVLPVSEYATYLQQATVFPNPFTTYLNIDFESTSPGTLQADLYAPNGTTLHHWQPKAFKAGGNTLRFDFMDNHKLIPGHYFLRLEDGDGRVETRVVIKG
ncbi:T9SS type A sorting domain-containing protein [Neolewinella aurantiaca]|uniref:T9SS type A sorting domain-containing protein n=1 Tax=Neolewinella aurantiaca TaxID=2602767 RepID=A0A5C7FLM1_9BACT|nr:carboxypeptidase-like regulatory domain-containing protein [Neolewinella aurantiaca]TXF86286.1 T9SS type A sorting domain-containing protein [Neolewinella aurantiaca]